VPAGVPEGPDDAVVVPEHEHRLGAGRGGDVGARPWELRHVTGELPCAGEDPFLLELEHLRIPVEPGREGG
jgi:hypothetical protein